MGRSQGPRTHTGLQLGVDVAQCVRVWLRGEGMDQRMRVWLSG